MKDKKEINKVVTYTYLYIRVSSNDQAEGNSLSAQKRAGKKYAEDNRLCITKILGGAESSKLPGRKQFGNLISKVENHLLDNSEECIVNVLVEKIDRLSRNDDDIHEIKQLIKKGLRIHLFRHNKVWDTNSSAMDVLASDIEMATGKYYLANLALESKKGMAERLHERLPHGPAPVGYRNYKANRRAKAEILIDENDGPSVIELFEKSASGNYSLNELQKFAASRRLMVKRETLSLVLEYKICYEIDIILANLNIMESMLRGITLL